MTLHHLNGDTQGKQSWMDGSGEISAPNGPGSTGHFKCSEKEGSNFKFLNFKFLKDGVNFSAILNK